MSDKPIYDKKAYDPTDLYMHGDHFYLKNYLSDFQTGNASDTLKDKYYPICIFFNDHENERYHCLQFGTDATRLLINQLEQRLNDHEDYLKQLGDS